MLKQQKLIFRELQAVFFLLALVGVSAIACDGRSETVYQEKAPAIKAQPGEQAQKAPQFKWQCPPTWQELPASGLRLAAFNPLPGDDTLQCTIVPLKGNAGGLQSNTARWLEQMGESVPDEAALDRFLKTQEQFESIGAFSVQIVDLSAWGKKNNEQRLVILAAIITVGEDSLFVKLIGPYSLLLPQKEAFLQLCRSIRLGDAS